MALNLSSQGRSYFMTPSLSWLGIGQNRFKSHSKAINQSHCSQMVACLSWSTAYTLITWDI